MVRGERARVLDQEDARAPARELVHLRVEPVDRIPFDEECRPHDLQVVLPLVDDDVPRNPQQRRQDLPGFVGRD